MKAARHIQGYRSGNTVADTVDDGDFCTAMEEAAIDLVVDLGRKVEHSKDLPFVACLRL